MIRVQSLARGYFRRLPLDSNNEEADAVELHLATVGQIRSRVLLMSANKQQHVEHSNKTNSAATSSSNVNDTAAEIVCLNEDEVPPLPVLSKLATMFQHAAVYNDEGAIRDLAIEPLLSACWAFEAQMRRLNLVVVANDFSRNILKVQSVLEKHSPTPSVKSVSCLLAFEKQKDPHRHCNTEGPRHHGAVVQLRDPSAAMGLLWIRRLLAFQYQTCCGTFLPSESQVKPPVAAVAAYRQELEPHYGNNLVLRRLVQLGCHVFIPSSERVFLAKLNGYDPRTMNEKQESHALQGMECFLKVVGPILECLKECYRDLDLEG